MFGVLCYNVSEQLANKAGRKFIDNPIEKYQRLLDSAENKDFESFDQDFESVTGRMPRSMMLKMMKSLRRQLGSESFEGMNDQDFENLIMTLPRMPQQFRPKIAAAANPNQPGAQGQITGANFVAQFDFSIQRIQTSATKAIPFDLPIHMFNPLNFSNQFSAFLTGLPAGVSVVVTPSGNNIDFVYTLGADVDTITVSGITQQYTTLLTGMMHAEFNVNQIMLTSTVANYAKWFGQLMSTGRKTLFGKVTDLDAIPFIGMKNEMANDPTILKLKTNLHFQNDKGLTYTIPQVFAEPLIVSIFVSNFIIK
jgi:hypothetical protein